MAISFEITADIRTDVGKGASRRLRRDGKVPAILYGGGRDPVQLSLSAQQIKRALENEAFYSHILELKVDGKAQQVVLRDVQRHPIRPVIEHMDFQRILADQKVRMNVPLHYVGEELAPATKMADVMISHLLSEVEVTCLPKDLPEFIEVNISELSLGDTVHLSDLKLPGGVDLIARGDELEEAVVTARHVTVQVEEEEKPEEETLEGEAEGEESEAPEGEEEKDAD